MNILALPAALVFTMNLTLCLIVLSFATWNLGEVVMISSLNPVHAILGVKVIFAGLTFAPLFFLHFSAEDEIEKVFLREAFKKNRGNISKTALDVEMDRRQLQNLIRKHRIVVKEFKDASKKEI
jgi:hypothetical protein